MLMDKSKSRTVSGKAKLSDKVWTFGEAVGMTTLSTKSKYVFRRQGCEAYKERMYPDLTLADAGVKDGDTVEFAGDFDEPPRTSAPPSTPAAALRNYPCGFLADSF